MTQKFKLEAMRNIAVAVLVGISAVVLVACYLVEVV